MCAERVTRFMTVVMLLVIMYFVGANTTIALALLAFMAIMMMIWGAFDFCPSIWMMRKILPRCYCECPKEENNE
jgi:hypothetical protein